MLSFRDRHFNDDILKDGTNKRIKNTSNWKEPSVLRAECRKSDWVLPPREYNDGFCIVWQKGSVQNLRRLDCQMHLKQEFDRVIPAKQ